MLFYYESRCQRIKCITSVALVSDLNATEIIQGIPCSPGLPNHFIFFSLQGVFCERVLRPRFENEPIFKLHLHTEKLVIRVQLSNHLHRASSRGQRLETGSEQGWEGWTGGLCWRFCPVALMLWQVELLPLPHSVFGSWHWGVGSVPAWWCEPAPSAAP